MDVCFGCSRSGSEFWCHIRMRNESKSQFPKTMRKDFELHHRNHSTDRLTQTTETETRRTNTDIYIPAASQINSKVRLYTLVNVTLLLLTKTNLIKILFIILKKLLI